MLRSRLPMLAAVLLSIASPHVACADEVGAKSRAVLDERGPTVVTVRMVLELEFGTQTREHRLTARGVLVSKTGLVMTGIGTIRPNVNVRNSRGRSVKVEVTPIDVKIVFGKEEEEHAAFVAVKDTKRGLAFLQIKDFKPPADVPWVDFAKGGKASVGDRVVLVSRLAKGYDYAPHFRLYRIIGEVKKPRRGFMVEGNGIGGLPAYTLDGKLVGCFGVIQASVAQNPRTLRVILASAEIDAVIKQAIKKAAERSEEDAEEEGEDKPDK